MAEWTTEAREYLDGYLKQVSVLVRKQRGDANEVVSGLRDHISNDVGSTGTATVSLDQLLDVLQRLGSPESVAALDLESLQLTPPLVLQRSTTSVNALKHFDGWRACGVLAFIGACIFVGLILISIAMYWLSYEPDASPNPGYMTEDEWGEAETID